MDIENVQDAFVNADIGPETAALFSAACRNVEILMALYREARQKDIAVPATLMLPVLSESEMKTQFIGNVSSLILFRGTAFEADNFLKGNNIGPQFAQHMDDAVRPDAPIHTTALVNVVGDDS